MGHTLSGFINFKKVVLVEQVILSLKIDKAQ